MSRPFAWRIKNSLTRLKDLGYYTTFSKSPKLGKPLLPILPVVIVWQELLNKNSKHSTQAVVFVAFQITILEQLILTFNSIVGINPHSKAISTECPHPPLREKIMIKKLIHVASTE